MLRDLAEFGYAVLPAVFDDRQVAELALAVEDAQRASVRARTPSRFEGYLTRRVDNLLAHSDRFWSVPTNRSILAAVETVLGSRAYLSAYMSAARQPGEVAQPLHVDDACFPIPRPHAALECVAMVAVTDFTEANGATRVVPGSHRFEHAPDWRTDWVTEHPDLVPVEMERGSVLIFDASVWHSAGANVTDAERVAFGLCYGPGWLRTHENYSLSLSRSLVMQFPTDLQGLVGMDVICGSLNHVEGLPPIEYLRQTSGVAAAGSRP